MGFSGVLVATGIALMVAGLITAGSPADEEGAPPRRNAGGPVFVSGLIILLVGLVGYGSSVYTIVARWTLMIFTIILLARAAPRR